MLSNADENAFQHWKNGESTTGKIGILEQVEEAEIPPVNKEPVTINKNHMCRPSGQRVTAWPFNRSREISFPNNVKATHDYFIDHLQPREQLIGRLHFCIRHIRELKEKIEQGNWNWENEAIAKGIDSIHKISAPTAARSMLRRIIACGSQVHAAIYAFYYMFSWGNLTPGGDMSAIKQNFLFKRTLSISYMLYPLI